MKSLNRTLSLVLALVMLLGLFGAASAAPFTDDDQIQYKEAVDVMSGIGAIDGMGNNIFAPKGNLTRAQAAKLVAYTILGADVAKNLPVRASSFKDVNSQTFAWAIPSIEYLVNLGSINGMGDGTFNPNGQVTGYQLAKMLLVALGVKGEFTGNSWELNTAIAAGKVKLFADSKATSYTVAATREEAALYCFNAILYSPTGSSTERIYGIVEWNEVNGTLVPKYGWIEVPAVVAGSIASTVYPTLQPKADDTDAFGRPASTWTYTAKNTVISSVVAEPVAVFTKAFTQHDLYKVLGAAASDVPLVVNSASGQDAVSTKIAAVKNASNPTTNRIANSANGVVTEIYKTADGLVAVQIIPSFAEVTNVASTKATATAGAYNTYTVGGLSGKVYTTIVDKEDDLDTANVSGSVAKGDKVLYYKDGDGILHIQAVDTVSGLLTAISSTGAITIGSVTTAKAGAYTGAEPAINAKQSQSFYVDGYGYLLGVKEAAAGAAKIAMLLGVDSYSELKDGKIVTSYAAAIVSADGSVSNVPTDEAAYTGRAALIGSTQAYTVSSKGVYSFTGATGTAVATIETRNATLASGLYANSATKFIVANYVVNADGQRIPAGTVTVYTGINNVPTFSGLTATKALDLSSPADTVADVVFVGDDLGASTASSYVYILGSYTDTAAGRVWNTLVNGAPATLTTATSVTTATLEPKTLYSSITVDSVGAVEVVKATTTIDKLGNVGGLLFASTDDGTTYAYVSGKTIADNVPVITIDKATGTAAASTGADLVVPVSGSDSIYVVYNPSNPNAVAAVYIIV